VRTIWTGRLAQTVGRYGDQAPTAAVCCNACRTCVTTNLVALATAAGAGLVAAVAHALRPGRSEPSVELLDRQAVGADVRTLVHH
jgi:hypothetical protein